MATATITQPVTTTQKTTKKSKPAVNAATQETTTKVKINRSMAEAPVKERRDHLVKALRKLQAVNSGTAVSINDLAKKLGYTAYDVYCLTYHKYPLAVQGFIKTAKHEGNRITMVYLTSKGQKTLPSEVK